ncbi:MAG TPA: glycosyltransferase family 4 protein [Bacteroidales bacterium]|nr:glycosyltransferase [Bacteroidales bacterium]HNR42940.1 glycosyltransferase family 4 protein [Bacteroidales bacterium]HQG77394.1 glycosyltransferase family 4 protein [Bacteroidales bacterium]
MNYVFIIDNLGSGGAERQIVTMAIAAVQRNHNAIILGYAKGDHFLDTIKSHGIDYYLIDDKNPFIRIWKFRKKISQLKPDTVIAFLRTASILAELAAIPVKRFNIVIQECNNIYQKFSLKNAFFLQFHRIADIVTTNSDYTTNAVLKRAPYLKRKTMTIYNGLDLNRFRPVNNYVPSTPKSFIVVSSHQAHKNAKGLILALDKIRKIKKDQTPKIFWYGSDLSEYLGAPSEAYIEATSLIKEYELGNVFFLEKPVTDIETIHHKVDAIIQCSFWEGMPNAICEGMASGLPVLMSQVSDFKVLTEGNGRSFNPDSVDEIVEAITWFCDLPLDDILKMRKTSREKAEKYFSVEKMVDTFLNLP